MREAGLLDTPENNAESTEMASAIEERARPLGLLPISRRSIMEIFGGSIEDLYGKIEKYPDVVSIYDGQDSTPSEHRRIRLLEE
jgi:hypothetical protein